LLSVMGNQVSLEAFDPKHVRIYSNLIQIQDPNTRVQMIQTCLNSIEYIQSAKRAGVYSYLLSYVTAVQNRQNPVALPGEKVVQASRVSHVQVSQNTGGMSVPRNMMSINQIVQYQEPPAKPSWQQITSTPKQKVLNYFSSCLEVLGIEEEVALTEESLKKAYKKAAIKAHPDKGGTEERFEAITRAYAYLSEILKRVQGGGRGSGGSGGNGTEKLESPSEVMNFRQKQAEELKHAEPVRLNPKNLNMTVFNDIFEKTHMPDPDSDGYGDWLKSSGNESESSGPKFGGKFNRDVFNSMFQEDARKKAAAANGGNMNTALMLHPDEMALTPSMGIEIGRDRPSEYTASATESMKRGGMVFTDLRSAYTKDSTFTQNVANVRVEDRDMKTYQAQRKNAPVPLSDYEREQLYASENALKQREQQRQLRKAQQDVIENQYFERMKQLVITDK
jgi:curved DNA-binding protein CbpA